MIRTTLLARAWGFLGVISAGLVLTGFSPFSTTAAGTCTTPPAPAALSTTYQQATTVAWLGIVACQVGTAIAARTDRLSLRSVGLASNPLLLDGIAVDLAFAAALIYVPFLHSIFGTAALSPAQLTIVLPYPFIVWGADETRRWNQRRRSAPQRNFLADASEKG